MSSTSRPHRHSFSMVPPLTEDTPSTELPSTFSSPVSASTPQGPGYPPGGLVGLGISGLDDFSSFSRATSFSVSPVMPTQAVAAHGFFNRPLKVDGFNAAPCFPAYNNLPVAPHSSISFCESHAMSASPSYNSSMDVSIGQTNFVGQMPDYWLPTPCSVPTSPLEFVPNLGSQPVGDSWTQQYFSETSVDTDPPAMPIGDIPSNSGTDASDAGLEQSLNMAQTPQRITSADCNSHNPSSKVRKDRRTSRKQPKSGNDKRYPCKICGFRFTRRSNCMEHQRKHDPRTRESHPCDECDKTFGRKADLNRHKNNVSGHKQAPMRPWLIF